MECLEANELLVAYLDGEVAPSERALIQGPPGWVRFLSKGTGCSVGDAEAYHAVPSGQSSTRGRLASSLEPSAGEAGRGSAPVVAFNAASTPDTGRWPHQPNP